MQSSNSNTNNPNIDDFVDDMSMGVKLTSRPVTTISTRNGQSHEHPISQNVIQESPWTLNNMLERYAFLDTYPWFAAQAPHTVLAKLRVPQDLIRTSISAAPFNSFTYWRGDVEVNFQVTSTPLTQGMAAAVFVPLSADRFIESTIVPNFSNISVNQVVYLYANTNTSAKMLISYNSPQAYLDLTEDLITTRNALGYIYIVVFNRIQLAATASDTSSVGVFTRFLDNEFKVPRVSTTTTVFARPQAMSMLGSVAASILTQHKKPPPSGQRSVLRSITDKLIPKGLVGDVIDSAMGVFGLDKPTDPTLQNPLQLLGTQRMNFSQGVDTIDKLTLYPSQTFESTHETFATTADEMDLNFLKKKYTYLGTFDFSTSSAIGSVIASWPINPLPSEYHNMEVVDSPLLSYISVPFQFWKGGLTYKIQVVSTSFQTGKIFFAFNFNTFLPATGLTLNQLTSQYGQAYEINQGSNELEFSVPFVANTPMLDVPNSNTPSLEDTVGYINVVVLNPLVAPNNTPTTISLNVFIAGADDFELSTLTQSNNLVPSQPIQLAELPEMEPLFANVSRRGIDPTYRIQVRTQSATAPLNTPMNEVDLAEESLVAPNTSTNVRIDTTQISPLSIRNILKKYQMMSNVVTAFPSDVQQGFVGTLRISELFGGLALTPAPFPPGVLQNSLGLWTHFQLLYRQFKGPLRFKVMLNGLTPNYSFSIFYQPPVAFDTLDSTAVHDAFANSMYITSNSSAPSHNGRTNFTRVTNMLRLPIAYVNGLQKTAEFEIPFSSKFMSILSWTGGASENELTTSPLIDLGRLVFYSPYAQEVTDLTPTLNVFMSIGDETRLGNLFQIPPLAVNSTVGPLGTLIASTWPDSYGTGAPVSNTLYRL